MTRSTVPTAMGGESGSSIGQIGWELGRAAGVASVLVAGLFLLLNYVLPLLLSTEQAARNRDLPILLAIVTAVGAAWISHKLGLSPALGAFIAGLMLAESPFATQIRADIGPLRTLFVTLFFSAIGMLSNPAWMLGHRASVADVGNSSPLVREYRIHPGETSLAPDAELSGHIVIVGFGPAGSSAAFAGSTASR